MEEIREGFVSLKERLAELELAAEDIGWRKMTFESENEFSRGGLDKLMRLAHLMYLKNPLIRQAVNVQARYIWALGITVQAVDKSVNEIVQAFWDDEKNKAELTSHQARMLKEIDLQLQGNLFFVFFRTEDRMRVRTIPTSEVREIITNPEDRRDVWYYKREYFQHELDFSSGMVTPQRAVAYYPDWRYNPQRKEQFIGEHPIHWESPVYHVKVGGTTEMQFGAPEIYAALDWARAVKEDLEDYATIRRALSKFVWHLTTKGGKDGIAAAKSKLGTTVGTATGVPETNPPPTVGSIFIGSEGNKIEPIKTSGAHPSPEEGRRLWLMVSSGAGLPETFFGDVSTGNLATAKSLDRPTELKFRDRQALWSDILKDILRYVVQQVFLVQNKAKLEVDSEEQLVVKMPDIDAHIDVNFPDLLERDTEQRIKAIVSAVTLDGKSLANVIDLETVIRMLLTALGEDDVDELVKKAIAEFEQAKAEQEELQKQQMQQQQAPANEEPVSAPEDEQLVLAVRELRAVLQEMQNASR